jgi:hypothetical protein
MAKVLEHWPIPAVTQRRRRRAARLRALAATVEPEWGPTGRPSLLWGLVGADRSGRVNERTTASKLLRHPERSPDARGREDAWRARRRDQFWTPATWQAAIDAWQDRYGVVPSAQDWSPEQIRYRNRGNAEERISRWREGWHDAKGRWHRYPRANEMPFANMVARVTARRSNGT